MRTNQTIPPKFITHCLACGINLSKGEEMPIVENKGFRLIQMYYAGRTLCLDVDIEGETKVITIGSATCTYGFFDGGGYRVPMSIKQMRFFRKLEKLEQERRKKLRKEGD